MRRKVLSLVLALCMVLSLMPMTAFAAPGDTFHDVDGHWGQSAIERWSEYGVVNGDGTGGFAPDKQMTRAEFATMLANMLGYKDKAANTFADVNDSDWFADAILKLAAAGVIQGSNGMANPNAPISRQEAAVMMCRAFNIPTTGGNLDFADSADVADWAKGAVAALADRGMMNGVGNNNVAPLADINRASVATLLDNMITEYVTEDKTITGEVSGIVLVAADATVTVEDATLNENLIVAPKADGAEVTLTGNTTASDVVVDAAATVKVDSNATAGEVQATTSAAVTVAGKVDAVGGDASVSVTETGKVDNVAGSDVTVEKGAAVKDVAADKVTVAQGASVESVVCNNVTVEKDASVGSLTLTDASAKAEVSGTVKNVTVQENATGATVNTNSGATVGKVETAAKDVTVSGNGKVENVTATGGTANVTTPGTSVENKTDNKDNVTNNGKPVEPSTGGNETPSTPGGSTGGGGNNTPATTYTITVAGSITHGSISTSVASAAEGTTVTVTGAPDATYALKTVTVTKVAAPSEGEEDVAALTDDEITVTKGATPNTFTFTMPASAVTVSGTFDTPLQDFGVSIVKDSASYKALPETFRTWDGGGDGWANLATNPWLAITGTIKGETLDNTGYADTIDRTGEMTITFTGNGQTKTVASTSPWNGRVVGKHGALTAYVNTSPEAGGAGDKLSVADNAGTFTVTLKYQGATYTGTVSYTKPGVVTHTVTFDVDGGSAVTAQTVANNEKATKPADPTKTGYTFDKWVTANGGSDAYDFNTAVTGDVTVFAKWTANQYDITYNLDGGTNNAGNPAKYTYGTAVTLNDPTKSGATFDGWYTDAQFKTKVTSITNTTTGNVTLYAKWKTLSVATFESADDDVLALYNSWAGVPTAMTSLQDGSLTFTKTGDGSSITVNVAGTLKYYETFTAMGNEGDVDRTKGHYMVFKVALPAGAATDDTVIITCNPDAGAGKTWTYKANQMDKIGNTTYWTSIVFIPDGSNPAPSLSYKIDWDGESGDKFSPVTYTFTFNDLTLQEKPANNA